MALGQDATKSYFCWSSILGHGDQSKKIPQAIGKGRPAHSQSRKKVLTFYEEKPTGESSLVAQLERKSYSGVGAK